MNTLNSETILREVATESDFPHQKSLKHTKLPFFTNLRAYIIQNK